MSKATIEIGRRFGIGMEANANVRRHASLDHVQNNVERAMNQLLAALLIDTKSDANTKNTAHRVARMFVTEVFSGRFTPPPALTVFPNTKELDELVTTGPLTVRSVCSHHFCPIIGKAWIGYVPGESILGLSKFNRVVEWYARRGQIQEELTIQIADHLDKALNPKGIAVVIKAQHLCMTWRGVHEHPDAVMTTAVMRGVFRTKPEARAEFMGLIA
jgi:GTP cyclohydrolase I